MIVTNYDTLGALARVDAPGAVLNVNAGSKTAPANALLTNAEQMADMAVHAGTIVTVHVEGDSTIPMPWSSAKQWRGPYVHQWDGVTLALLGSNLDPATNSAPGSNGDRFQAMRPRIASDDIDLFVAYYDQVVTNISTGSAPENWLRIAHWTGAAWAEVASEQIHDVSGGRTVGLTVAGGIAYCVYTADTNETRVRVFRSDGSGDWLPDSGNQYVAYGGTGYCAAYTTSSGRPVGFYTRADRAFGELVMFDLETLAVIARTSTPAGPSALVPYGTNAQLNDFVTLKGCASAYNGRIALGCDSHGIVIIGEDGVGGFTTIDGAEAVAEGTGHSIGSIAEDTSDARELWLVYANTQKGPPGITYQWEAACQSAHIPGTPLNPWPFTVYDGYSVPVEDTYTLPHSFVEVFGQPRLATLGDSLFVFYVYYPADVSSPLATEPYWTQFVLYRFDITRGGGVCPAYLTPLFGSRFKVGSE